MSSFSNPEDEQLEDPYAILGLEEDATPEQIRQAYRDLVRQYHPDAGFITGTALLFRRIQQAYETLMDSERRRRHDEMLRREGKRPTPLLDLDVMLGPTPLPCIDDVQLLYVLVKITPLSLEPVARTPLNISLVIDHSTSMKGARLAAVREATISLVNQLEPDDIFSLVVFADRAKVVVPAQQNPDRHALRSVLSTIRASGGTEIYQGLMAGLNEVRRMRSDRPINHVILLTDGHTYGDAEKCLLAARLAARENIGISGLGVGIDWNEDFLDQLAAAGGGTVLYIEDPARIGEAFQRKLRDLKDAWIPDLTLRLHFDPIANLKESFLIFPELRRLAERSPDSEVSLGPLQRTSACTVLMETLVSPQPEGLHRIMQIEARGVAPAFGIIAKRQKAVRVEFSPMSPTCPLIPAAIEDAVRRISLLRTQERAYEEAQRGLIAPASARLEQLAGDVLQNGQAELARALQEEAQALAKTGTLTEAGAKRIRYGTRSLARPIT